MSWHRLVKGADDGGERWHLDGRPIHCGDGLELRLPRGRGSVRVRFELEFSRDAPNGAPVLYLATGVDPYGLDPGDPSSATDDLGPALSMRPEGGTGWDEIDLRWPGA